MASSAIPLFFPAINIEGRYMGDGCLRNIAPLSPAIHLGSNRVIAIGVRKEMASTDKKVLLDNPPSAGRVLNTILNAVLLDAIHGDVERLLRINNTLKAVPEAERKKLPLRLVEIFWIYPSEDIGLMAQEEAWRLPKIVHYLLGGLGTIEETSEIVSYLLFDPEFCARLIDLGYRDLMNRKSDALDFINS
jgi:NTE family protein